ncbi:MAG: LysR family transcriptional regulator [Dermatophilaceae bacterium]
MDVPDLRSLRSFVAVAEELHFGRAARRLFLAQPSLSAQINRLERLLGARLFDRDRHHVALTDAGTALLPEARRTLLAAERAAAAVQRVTSQPTGRLVVGCCGAAAQDYAAPVFGGFTAAFPDVTLEVRHAQATEPTAGLDRGRVDTVITWRQPPAPEFLSRTLLHDRWHAVVPDRHPLARRDQVRVGELAGSPRLPLVPQPPDSSWWDGRARAGERVFESYESASAAVLGDRGVTAVPGTAARLYGQPGLAYPQLSDAPDAVAVVMWADQPAPGTALLAFLEHLAGVLP